MTEEKNIIKRNTIKIDKRTRIKKYRHLRYKDNNMRKEEKAKDTQKQENKARKERKRRREIYEDIGIVINNLERNKREKENKRRRKICEKRT